MFQCATSVNHSFAKAPYSLYSGEFRLAHGVLISLSLQSRLVIRFHANVEHYPKREISENQENALIVIG